MVQIGTIQLSVTCIYLPMWNYFVCLLFGTHGIDKPFSNIMSKMLFDILKVGSELCLIYIPVLFWVTFVIRLD